MKDEKDFYIEALQAKLAYVTQTLAPLCDDDNRPVEALARLAIGTVVATNRRLAEAEALLELVAGFFADKLNAYIEGRDSTTETVSGVAK